MFGIVPFQRIVCTHPFDAIPNGNIDSILKLNRSTVNNQSSSSGMDPSNNDMVQTEEQARPNDVSPRISSVNEKPSRNDHFDGLPQNVNHSLEKTSNSESVEPIASFRSVVLTDYQEAGPSGLRTKIKEEEICAPILEFSNSNESAISALIQER